MPNGFKVNDQISDISGLQGALDGKAASSHTHAQSDVTGLVSALSGKAATSHTHAQSDVTGLVTDLAGKAASAHTHSATDITSGTLANARTTATTAANNSTIALRTSSGTLIAKGLTSAPGSSQTGLSIIPASGHTGAIIETNTEPGNGYLYLTTNGEMTNAAEAGYISLTLYTLGGSANILEVKDINSTLLASITAGGGFVGDGSGIYNLSPTNLIGFSSDASKYLAGDGSWIPFPTFPDVSAYPTITTGPLTLTWDSGGSSATLVTSVDGFVGAVDLTATYAALSGATFNGTLATAYGVDLVVGGIAQIVGSTGDINGNALNVSTVNSSYYNVGGTPGWSGTFYDYSNNAITVTNGIITGGPA